MPSGNRASWEVKGLHCFGGANDKVYLVVIDQVGTQFVVRGYYGKRTKTNLTMDQKGTWGSLLLAKSEANNLFHAKRSKGYIDVEDFGYADKVPSSYQVNLAGLLSKIDTTRIVGYADVAPGQGATVHTAPTGKKTKLSAHDKVSRAERSVKL